MSFSVATNSGVARIQNEEQYDTIVYHPLSGKIKEIKRESDNTSSSKIDVDPPLIEFNDYFSADILPEKTFVRADTEFKIVRDDFKRRVTDSVVTKEEEKKEK